MSSTRFFTRNSALAAVLALSTAAAHAASVNWLPDSSGSWTDPANWSSNALPGPGDDVTIFQPDPITVTLSSGNQSIYALTSFNNLTLAGGSLSVATTFQIANNTVTLTGATLQDSSISVATPQSALDLVIGTLSNVTINGNVSQLSDHSSTVLYLSGTITNNGNWTQAPANTSLPLNGNAIYLKADTTLAGTGAINLSLGTFTASSDYVLTVGSNQTISGTGAISALTLHNQGTILAVSPQGYANLSVSIPAGTTLTNSGTMEATPRTALNFASSGAASIDNTNGIIACYGDGSSSCQSVSLTGISLTGGQLLTDANGVIVLSQSSLANTSLSGVFDVRDANSLANLSLAGSFLQSGANISLAGTITNNANWVQESPAAMTTTLNGNVTLNGNGTLHLIQTLRTGPAGGSLTVGTTAAIQGFGTFKDVLLLNSGTISATGLNGFALQLPGGSANNGTIAAVGGNISLSGPLGAGGSLNNTGGTISATGSNQLSITAFTISGGTLSSDPAGAINLLNNANINNASLSGAILLNGFGINLADDSFAGSVSQATSTLNLSGTITNNAAWTQAASSNTLTLLANTTLAGDGSLSLQNAQLNGPANSSLSIAPNATLQGSGQINPSACLTLFNAGTIRANVPNANLSLSITANSTNSGSLESINNANLLLSGVYSNASLDNTGGAIHARSNLLNGQYVSAGNITIATLPISGGQLIADTNALITLAGGASLTNVSTAGNLSLAGNPISFNNVTLAGNVTQAGACSLSLSGKIINNALWIASNSAQLNLTADTKLTGNGTLSLVNVSILNANNARFTVAGNQTITGSGTINISGDPAIASFTNVATINANAANPLNITSPAPAANSGTLKATNGATLNFSSSFPFNNSGGNIAAFAAPNGTPSTVTISAPLLSGGQLSTDASSQIILQSNLALANASVSGNLLANGSNISFSNDSFSGSVSLANTVALSGTLTNNATWTPASGAAFLLDGNVTLNGNGSFSYPGTSLTTTGGFATLTIGPGQTFTGHGAISSAVTLINHGTLVAAGPSQLNLSTNLTSDGTIIINSAASLAAPNILLNGGLLAGNGTVYKVVSAGNAPHTIHPGFPNQSTPGTLTIATLNTNANTTLAFNLLAPATPSTASNNDRIIDTDLNLNGATLQITSAPAGAAALGYYSLLQFTHITGSLASILLPTPPSPNLLYSLDATRDPNTIDLHIGLRGDANDDAHVDLTDLSIVLHNFGAPTSAWTSGNFDGQPSIDLTDLADVLNNINLTNSNPTHQMPIPNYQLPGAPEPATAFLALFPLALTPLRRRQRLA